MQESGSGRTTRAAGRFSTGYTKFITGDRQLSASKMNLVTTGNTKFSVGNPQFSTGKQIV